MSSLFPGGGCALRPARRRLRGSAWSWLVLAACSPPPLEVVGPPHFAGCEQVLAGPVCVAGEGDLVVWLPESPTGERSSVWVDGEERPVRRQPAPGGQRLTIPLPPGATQVEIRSSKGRQRLAIAHEGPWDDTLAHGTRALSAGDDDSMRAADEDALASGSVSIRVGLAVREALQHVSSDPDTARRWLSGVTPDPRDLRSVFRHAWASCRLHIANGEAGEAVVACQRAVTAAARWGEPMPLAESGLLQATVWQAIGLHEPSLRAIHEHGTTKIERSSNPPCATAEVLNNTAWGLLRARDAGQGPDTWREPFDPPTGTDPDALLAAARALVVEHDCAVPNLGFLTLTQAQQAWLRGDLDSVDALLADASLADVDDGARFWAQELSARLAGDVGSFAALLEQTQRPGMQRFAWRAHYGLAAALRRAGRNPEALEAYKAGTEAFRALLKTIPYDAGRAEAASIRRAAVRDHVAALLHHGEQARALDVMRGYRAEYVASLHRQVPPADDLRAPEPGELLLAWFELDDGWVAWAATTESTRAVHLHTDPTAAPLAPFGPELATAIAVGGQVTVLATGSMRQVDVHAAEMDGAPLIARLPVRYSLDLPPTEPTPRRTSLVLVDPTGDLPHAARTRASVEATCCGPGALTLQGVDARSSTTLDALDEGIDLFHFDGHARVRKGQPYPVLELADGVLTVDEILAIPPPNLAVLLACGSGVTRHTEVASLGLAQAFLVTGTPAAIGTTTIISDEIAARFAAAFYIHRLATPDDPTMAYTRTLRELLRGPSDQWKRLRMWIR